MASTGLGLATFPSSARRASGALASTPPRAPLTARRASPRDIPPRVETFLDVPELVRGLESSPVRSRLLTNALRHSVERTVDEWRAQRGADLHPDSQPPPPRPPRPTSFVSSANDSGATCTSATTTPRAAVTPPAPAPADDSPRAEISLSRSDPSARTAARGPARTSRAFDRTSEAT